MSFQPGPRTVLYVLLAVAVLAVGWRYQRQSSAAAVAPAPRVQSQPAPSRPVVVVHVTGAVLRPGVYRLPGAARVQDALRKAGIGRRADLAAVNLAALLADGEQIVVPRRGHTAATAPAAGPAAPVHLNSATLEQLEELDGIGPTLAQRILDYRTEHGGFRSLEELDQVSGFGPGRLAALEGSVAL